MGLFLRLFTSLPFYFFLFNPSNFYKSRYKVKRLKTGFLEVQNSEEAPRKSLRLKKAKKDQESLRFRKSEEAPRKSLRLKKAKKDQEKLEVQKKRRSSKEKLAVKAAPKIACV